MVLATNTNVVPTIHPAHLEHLRVAKDTHNTLGKVLSTMDKLHKTMSGSLGNDGIFSDMHETMKKNGQPAAPIVNVMPHAPAKPDDHAKYDPTGIDVRKRSRK